MLTVVRCLYRPGGADERLHIRDVHVEYMIANRRWLEQGGALMSADGTTVEGMFLILRYDSREDIQTFLSNEPYTRAGLFEKATIERFDRFVPHCDPEFLEMLLVKARDWIVQCEVKNRESQTTCSQK
jgi:uncharacterized protein YciI